MKSKNNFLGNIFGALFLLLVCSLSVTSVYAIGMLESPTAVSVGVSDSSMLVYPTTGSKPIMIDNGGTSIAQSGKFKLQIGEQQTISQHLVLTLTDVNTIITGHEFNGYAINFNICSYGGGDVVACAIFTADKGESVTYTIDDTQTLTITPVTLNFVNGVEDTAVVYFKWAITGKTANHHNPDITGISGPQTLQVNEKGKWSVLANDKDNDQLSYAIDWGENIIYPTAQSPGMLVEAQQSTFTHSYDYAGTYTITVDVSDGHGGSAQSTITVTVVDEGSTIPGPAEPPLPVNKDARLKELYKQLLKIVAEIVRLQAD